MVLAYTDENLYRSDITPPLLDIQLMSKSFGLKPVIQDFCFKIAEGEIAGIFGKPNSGKSAVISLLSGEASPTSGQILFRGEDIQNLSHGTRQENGILRNLPISSLMPELSVRDNLLLLGAANLWPLFPRQGYAQYDAEAARLLELAGLKELACKPVQALSQTQKYFLTIAIALAGSPDLLLLDNPFLEIDNGHSELAALLTRISDSGTSVLFTAEWLYPAIDICDRVAVLHDGEVVAKGLPSCFTDNPAMVSAYLKN